MKIWRKIFFLIIAFFSLGLSPAYAQYGQEYGANLELGQTSPLDLAINIINWSLGILALIAMIIILWGGFVWLTSGGNEEKLEQAKKILRNGAIGLVIILSAWGITYWVLNTLADLTGADTDPYVTPEPGPDIGGTSEFYITAVDPSDGDTDVSLCHIIQVFFNLEVVESTVNSSNFCIYPEGSTCEDGLGGSFAIPENGKGFVFYPEEDYLESTVYHVEMTTNIQGVGDDLIAYSLGSTDPYLDFSFTTGTETDTTPPYVNVTDFYTPVPADGEDDACLNTAIKVTFSESIDSASLNDENVWLFEGTTPADSLDVRNIGTMSLTETADTLSTYPEHTLTAFTDYGLSLYSGDPENNFDGAIRDTCGNPLDGDYDGVAEGYPVDDFADPANAVNTISSDWSYPWNFTTGENASCVPVISSFTPDSGYYNTEVTLTGLYLDQYTDMFFYNGISAASTGCFDDNYQVNQSCIDPTSVTDSTMVVKTPVSARTGILAVEGPDGTGYSSSDYTVNSPYISRLSPSTGPVGQAITIKGSNFGDYDPTDGGLTSRGIVYFRDFTAGVDIIADFPCDDGWDDDEIIISVPEGVDTLSDINIQVVLSDDTHYSNYRDFTYESGTPGPTLCTIYPSCSEDGNENIDLGAVGLSEDQGSSFFYNYDAGTDAEAPISIWDVPGGLVTLTSAPISYIATAGEFNVVVQNSDGSESNGLDFDMPCNDSPSVVQSGSCRPDDDVFPLPNPYLNEDEACRNSAVQVGFDQTMDDTTFTSDNIAIYKCNHGYDEVSDDVDYSSGDCDTTTNLLSTSLIDEDYITSGGYDGFMINGFSFSAGYWYQINLGTGLLADTGAGLASDYNWSFRIRELDEDCEADYLNLSPSYRNFNSFDDTTFDTSDYTSWQNFTASPYTVECIALSDQETTWVINEENDDVYTETTQEVVSFNNDLTLKTFDTSPDGAMNIYMMGDTDDVNEGDVYLGAEVDGGASDVVPISVDFGYCETTAACQASCPGSVCDLEAHRCTPVISSVSPDNGGEGSCVTISGCYFGDDPGESGPGQVVLEDSAFTYPANVNCDNWQDEQIVAKVPGVALGDYTLTLTSAYNLTATADFTVNEEQRPCLCAIDPDQTEEGADAILYGEGFDTYSYANSAVSFYSTPDRAESTIAEDDAGLPDWQDTEIHTSYPDGATTGLAREENDGVYVVDSTGTASNPLDIVVTCNQDSDCGTGCCSEGLCAEAGVCNECLTATDCTDEYAGCYGDCVEGTCEPYIASISPSSGDTGQPVTVSGCYFGESGTVYFDEEPADELCYGSWSNIEVIVETPDSDAWTSEADEDLEANIFLTNDVSLTSNSVLFNLDNSCAGYAYPILCSLNPSSGSYEYDADLEGFNFADVEEQYCLCYNPDSEENCAVALGTGSRTCSGDNTCQLEAECTENRDSYDSATETCSCYNDAEELVCSVDLGDSSCDYEFDCELSSDCTIDSDYYHNVGGYLNWPGSGSFSEADYADAYNKPSADSNYTELNTMVPSYEDGATSGTVYVGTRDTETSQVCQSNGLEHSIICNSCSDTPDNMYCDLSYGEGSYGRVTSNPAGYCQDGYEDSCCGSTGCVVDDETGLGTCTERPEIVSVSPVDGDDDACLNAMIRVTFSEYMNYSGNVGASEHINLKIGGASGTEVDTTVTTLDDKTFYITPVDGTALLPSTTYYLEVISNSSDESGMVGMDSGLAVDQTAPSYTSFTTASDACPIDLVEIEAVSSEFADTYTLSYEGETQNVTATAYSDDPDTCTCTSGSETCEVPYGDEECYFDDSDYCELPVGHCLISSDTYHDNRQELRSIDGYYSWVWSWSPEFNESPTSDSDCDIAGIYTSVEGYDSTYKTQTVIAGSQQGDISITATATSDEGWTGSETGSQTIYVDSCPTDYTWSYFDNRYKIRMRYCASEEGDSETALPMLRARPTIISVGSDAMYQLLFTFTSDSGNEDAIGLRVYANDLEDQDLLDGINDNTTHIDAVSPELWYQNFFESSDSVSTTTIDGWPAARVGRSTYIAATNDYLGNLYPNIYLLSYSQDASTDTQEVVNQILSNITIATNVDSACGSEDSDKQKVIRDTERLTEIGTMAYYLSEYNDSNGSYPALITGSYIQGMSTSKWPSWQSTLGNDLGYALPEDPVNAFYTVGDDPCTGDYASDTCWDDTNKKFLGPGSSYYPSYYLYSTDGSTFNLYANLEYTDGNWDTTVSDPCTGSSTCSSFNYQLNSSVYEAL